MCRCFTATCTRQSAWRADDTVPDAPRLRKRRSASLCEGTAGSALQMGSALMVPGRAARSRGPAPPAPPLLPAGPPAAGGC